MNKKLLATHIEAHAPAILAECVPLHINLTSLQSAFPLDEDHLRSIIRQHHPNGLWSDDPKTWIALQPLADHFNLPSLPVDALSDAVVNAIIVPPEMDAVGQAASMWGLPLWISPYDHALYSLTMRVDHMADLDLALMKMKRLHPGSDIRVQPAPQGATYLVAGFKTGQDFHVAGVIEETPFPGPYRVPMQWTLPAGLSQAAQAALIEKVHQRATLLPDGQGPVLLLAAKTANGFNIINAQPVAGLNEPLCKLLQCGLGIDFLADTLRVAVDEEPFCSLRCNMSAAVRWMNAPSGRVESVEGVESVRSMPYIHEVHVNVQPGDSLGHSIDIPSRDRIGWTLACTATRNQTLAFTEKAHRILEVHTQRTLD